MGLQVLLRCNHMPRIAIPSPSFPSRVSSHDSRTSCMSAEWSLASTSHSETPGVSKTIGMSRQRILCSGILNANALHCDVHATRLMENCIVSMVPKKHQASFSLSLSPPPLAYFPLSSVTTFRFTALNTVVTGGSGAPLLSA